MCCLYLKMCVWVRIHVCERDRKSDRYREGETKGGEQKTARNALPITDLKRLAS